MCALAWTQGRRNTKSGSTARSRRASERSRRTSESPENGTRKAKARAEKLRGAAANEKRRRNTAAAFRFQQPDNTGQRRTVSVRCSPGAQAPKVRGGGAYACRQVFWLMGRRLSRLPSPGASDIRGFGSPNTAAAPCGILTRFLIQPPPVGEVTCGVSSLFGRNITEMNTEVKSELPALRGATGNCISLGGNVE